MRNLTLMILPIVIGFLIIGIISNSEEITTPIFEIFIGIGLLLLGYGVIRILRNKNRDYGK